MKETFRCPICLFTMSRAEDYPPDAILECVSCNKSFRFKEALPPAKSAPVLDDSAPPKPELAADGYVALLLITGIVLILAVALTVAKGGAMRGPEFLKAYAICGAVTLVGQFIVRVAWRDMLIISILAFVIFEAIGLTRFIHGYYFLEMKKWTYLFLMMGGGGLLHFLRSEHLEGMGSSSSCSSFSSCGGGGCGGGGCGGGCGGCGG